LYNRCAAIQLNVIALLSRKEHVQAAQNIVDVFVKKAVSG
jgi:hypothetical protein